VAEDVAAYAAGGRELLNFPRWLAQSGWLVVSRRNRRRRTRGHGATQRLLHTNVQEALALEVGLLKLHL
jgi:hypothetical protein